MDDPARPADELLHDRAVDAKVEGPEVLARSYRVLEKYQVVLPDGSNRVLSRDVVRVGQVVAVLAIDPERDEVILMREFRLGAHLANGKGELVELPAGRVDPGEDLLAAARRECHEEIGVAPKRLVKMFTVLPTAAVSDEEITFFLGVVDASQVPAQAGNPDEHEVTHPFRVPIDDALAALAVGTMKYAALVLALQWLALNRHCMDAVLSGEVARR